MTTPEQRREYNKRWREAHPDYFKNWLANNRERHNEYCRNYQSKHRKAQQKRMNDYHQTKEGRATNLLAAYVQMDLERRGERPQLTQADIMRICFSDTSKCVYCGETEWTKLGLDRIDNDRPHDRCNVLCSCHDCNVERYRRPLGEYVREKRGMSLEEFMEQNSMRYADDCFVLRYPEIEKNCG